MHSRTHIALSIFLTAIVTLYASPGFAVPNEATSCNQNGSEITGGCTDGSRFSLDCVDDEGGNEIECDYDDETLWGLCDDQCTAVSGHTWSKFERERTKGVNEESAANRAKSRSANATVPSAQAARAKPKSALSRVRGRKAPAYVRTSRKGRLSIVHRSSRSGAERVIWTYQDRSGNIISLNCNLDEEQCAAFENGQRLTVDNISQNGLAMATDANQLMTQVNMEDIIDTDAVDAICFAAGIAASAWPIGTLVAGPTAVGCLVIYALQ